MLLKIKKCGKKSAQKHTHAIQAFFYNDKKIKTDRGTHRQTGADRGRQGDADRGTYHLSFLTAASIIVLLIPVILLNVLILISSFL